MADLERQPIFHNRFRNIQTFHFNIADFFISLWQISSEQDVRTHESNKKGP